MPLIRDGNKNISPGRGQRRRREKKETRTLGIFVSETTDFSGISRYFLRWKKKEKGARVSYEKLYEMYVM